jgi:hypothetical protein
MHAGNRLQTGGRGRRVERTEGVHYREDAEVPVKVSVDERPRAYYLYDLSGV